MLVFQCFLMDFCSIKNYKYEDKSKIDSRYHRLVADRSDSYYSHLVAIKENDGNISIKNTETGEVTAEKIKFDWTSASPNDSLGVFCSDGKRGYYNSYTGKIVVEAQYRRAWVFSEGLAAVQKNGHIGFINRKGEVVIPFRYP